MIDKFDNCPYHANANQLDTDKDGKGKNIILIAEIRYFKPAANETGRNIL